MKIFQTLRRYGAPVILSLLSASYIANAQIVNPSAPATGVPLPGTGISVAGQTVSVNYGVANSPFTGNMTIGGTLGVTGATTLAGTSATTLSASSTVSGAGFTAFMASPPAIGSTAANSGAFTTLTNSGTLTSTGAAVLNGAVSGAGLATYEANLAHVQTVLNVAALRALSCVPGLLYADQGYTTQNDGGNAQYVCTNDTTSTDNGGNILATANSNRLYMQVTGPINGRAFGMKCDNSTNDLVALQNAAAFAQKNSDPATYASNSPYLGPRQLFLPPGYCLIPGTVTITKNIAIEGAGQTEFSTGTRLVETLTNTDLFFINPIAQGISWSIEKCTLLSNIGGTGALIHQIRSASPSTANSVRIVNNVFGTPQSLAINIEAGDDLWINDNLFDVAATSAIALGTATSTNVVSNFSISRNTFFQIGQNTILPYNVDGGVIAENRVYNNTGQNVGYFINGIDTLPFQIKNLTVTANKLTGVLYPFAFTSVNNLVIADNVGSLLGTATSPARSAFTFTGTNSNVTIAGNSLSGQWATLPFFTDSGNTISSANIAHNVFAITAGTGQAISAAATTGKISDNTCTGFTPPSVGCKLATTGSTFNPGTITTNNVNTVNYTVNGAVQGDRVSLTTTSLTWPLPATVTASAFISAANTVTVRYLNPGAGSQVVTAHDWTVEVDR